MTDPEYAELVALLEKLLKDGELSLKEIRMKGMQPTQAGFCRRRHPEKFIALDKNGHGYMALRQPPLSDREQKLVGKLRFARHGISLGRLWGSDKYSETEANDFVLKYRDIASIVERADSKGKLKKFIILNTFVPPIVQQAYEPIPEEAPDASEASTPFFYQPRTQTRL